MAITSENLYSTAGIRLPKDACVVIVYTEWNEMTIGKLKEGCCKVLDEHQIKYVLLQVPGAFEIPFAVKAYWDHHKGKGSQPNAFIALGCVLRGGTPHFEYVSNAVTDGIAQLNLILPVPVIFGVLTVDTQLQADERTGGIHGHKGEEAALTAIKMISFTNNIS